ncbi:hypothetical protein ACP4OV_008940 [Aristida adscensionis]
MSLGRKAIMVLFFAALVAAVTVFSTCDAAEGPTVEVEFSTQKSIARVLGTSAMTSFGCAGMTVKAMAKATTLIANTPLKTSRPTAAAAIIRGSLMDELFSMRANI